MTQPPGYPGEPYHQNPASAPPWQAVGYPEQQYGQQPYPQQPFSQQPTEPYGQPPDPYAQGAYGYSGPPYPTAAPRRGRGLLIGMIVLVFVLLLSGGTALFLVFGRSEGKGEASPSVAVDKFLTAVFKDKSTAIAERLTCRSARKDNIIRKRVDELRAFELRYKSPTYTWPSPTVETQQSKSATVTVALKLTTSDDRVADQRLRFVTVKGDGWLVCEISAG